MNRFLKRFRWFPYLFIILEIVYIYSPILSYGFWKDDWGYYLGALHNTTYFRTYLLHPGTTLEFRILSGIFGMNIFLWMCVGLVLKIIATWAVYRTLNLLVKGNGVSFLYAALYGIFPAGIDGIGWTSAHIVIIITTIIICLFRNLYLWNDTKLKRYGVYAILFSLLAIILDPGRSIPVIIISWLLFFPYQKKIMYYVKNPIVWIFGIAFTTLLVIILRKEIVDTQIFQYVKYCISSPSKAYHSLGYIWTYFQSILILLFGWVYPFVENASTGIYEKYLGILGFIGIFSFIIGWFVRDFLLYKKLSTGFRLSILVLASYMPNWLFEPRLSMGITHRYMALSGAFYILILGYLFKKNIYVASIVFCIFFFGSIHTTKSYIHQWNEYRNESIQASIWNKINTIIGPRKSIVIVTGSGNIFTHNIYYSQALPLAAYFHIKNIYDYPIYFDSEKEAIKLFCKEKIQYEVMKQKYSYENTHRLNDMYRFDILPTGEVVDLTHVFRNKVVKEMPCKIVTHSLREIE